MLKITTIDGPFKRTLLVEGKLIEPWLNELRSAWDVAREANSQPIVVDLRNTTVISQEGERLLSQLKNEGAQFSCNGVLTRYVVRQLTRRCGRREEG